MAPEESGLTQWRASKDEITSSTLVSVSRRRAQLEGAKNTPQVPVNQRRRVDNANLAGTRLERAWKPAGKRTVGIL